MATNWTPHQKAAIEARGRSLMISAAAGSGKTSVLTQRIVSLLAEKDGIRADRLAVVTFTKAAAGGLEDKLYRALSDLVAKEPENRALSSQLMALSRAQISTIHSFCFSLIRTYQKELGLVGKIRIADPCRLEPIQKKAIEDAVEAFLSQGDEDTKAKRESICRIFGTARSLAGLYDALAALFEKVSFLPGGIASLLERHKALEEEWQACTEGRLSLSESRFGKSVVQYAEALFTRGQKVLLALTDPLSRTQVTGEKYIPFLEERAKALERCLALIRGGDLFQGGAEMEKLLEASLPRITKCPPEEKDLKDAAAEIHNRLKKELFAFSRDHLKTPLPSLLEEVGRSLSLTKEFLVLGEMALALFAEEKRKKGLVDYADLENLTLSLVAEKKDGVWQKSEMGRRITEEFDAVFVDEYQDSNEIQDLIFRCVTREDNLFIVGDPKQSIYRFRGAEPEIFSRYKNTLPRYPAEGSGMQTIFLSDNFRCDEPIIDLVNRVFRVMMDARDENSLYKKEDELRFGRGKNEGKKPQNTEIVLMEKKKEEEREVLSEAAQLLREENLEAKYIASRIRSLLSDYKPEDIAVICRTHRQIAMVRESLAKLAIPCSTGKDGAMSEDGEFLFVHSLLLTLDNPGADVPLLGTLLSPVFRFSSDDLYRIRKGKKDGSFYTALKWAAEHDSPDGRAKAKEVLHALSQLREKSKHLTLPALIFALYRSLSVWELYGGRDRSVKEFFLRCAESAESAGDTGLSEFARYAQRSAEDDPKSGEDAPGIRLMTIHKSKGLEFPVVFVSFLAQKFDTRDESAKLILSPDLGPAFHLPALSGRAKVNTFLRKSARILLHDAMVQEEKRVLYVALTRAAEKLIITANPRSYASLSRNLLLLCDGPFEHDLTRLLTDHAGDPLTLLLLPLRQSPALRRILEAGGEETDGSLTFSMAAPLPAHALAETREETKEREMDVEDLIEKLDFQYESHGLETLPKKLSVSQLLRQEREEEANLYPHRLLDFEKGSLKSSAARIGTATHQVMQFASFECLATDPEKEFARLEEKGFLSREEIALVEKDKIRAFFASPLYKKMAASPRVVREKRFNVLLSAKELLGREGEILVQGVVDAWFENADGTVTLLDFKTDRVRRENGEEILRERHGRQLRLYAMAVEEITGRAVSSLFLYSFSLGREIPIPRREEATL